MAAGWTEKRTELLRKLWADGETASQIAERFGVTRNAICGKLHRIGLGGERQLDGSNISQKSKKAKPARRADAFYAQQKKKRTPLRRQLPIKPEPEPALEPQPGDEVDLDYNDGAFVCESAGVGIVGLMPHHCRWPLGDPRTDSFRYCGATRVGNGGVFDVYCAHHARIGYVPKSKANTFIPRRVAAK